LTIKNSPRSLHGEFFTINLQEQQPAFTVSRYNLTLQMIVEPAWVVLATSLNQKPGQQGPNVKLARPRLSQPHPNPIFRRIVPGSWSGHLVVA
jgi:hypothetical protein